MSLIGIHESCEGSELISIRAKEYIKDNDESPVDIGLGPDDIVTLQKKLEKKSDKATKIKSQDKNSNRRKLSNENTTKQLYDSDFIKKMQFFNKNADENSNNEQLLLLNNNNKLYSHSPGGFNLNSQASFPAYFSELLRRSTPTQKKSFWHTFFRPRTNSGNSNSLNIKGISGTYNTCYDDSFVSKGCYYSYNIFTHKDIIVTVDNPGGCQTMMVNDKGEFDNNLTNDDWRQVCLSSKLRFYRCSQPLLSSFMFSNPIMTVCYYVYEVPYMNGDDFEYCMEHYVHDSFESNDEFEMSIAMSLIVNCDLKYVLKFIEKYDEKYPRLLLHIIKHIAPSSSFCKMLIPALINHMMMFNDDIDVAVIFFDIALINLRFDICMSFLIPLLNGSIWATPQCGISFARFCIKNNLFDEALEFLNLACVVNAKKQKKNGYYSQASDKVPWKTLPRSKSLSDSNNKSPSAPTFLRSTSMTLSIKKKGEERNHNNHLSNDYEFDNEGIPNLGLVFNAKNDYYRYISSSESSKFNSPQHSRKNSNLDDESSSLNQHDDYETFSSSKPNSRASSLRGKKKNSCTEEKSQQNFALCDDNELCSSSKLSSPQYSRTNSYIEDNHGKFDNDSFSSSRPSSRLSSTYIEETSMNNQNVQSVFSDTNDLSNLYFKYAHNLTTPIDSPEYGPSQSSCYLLKNHFTALKSQILFTLSELIDKLGEAEFDNKRNEFLKERPIPDEEEMLFDDESEVYTSYFCSPVSPEEDYMEEEEEFISIHDNAKIQDMADNDKNGYTNYNSTVVNKNDKNSTNGNENNQKNNNNDNSISNNDNAMNNTENNKSNFPLFQHKVTNDNNNNNDSKINTLSVPDFHQPSINFKSQTSKSVGHIYFKINNKNNNDNTEANSRRVRSKIDSLPHDILFDPGIEASFDTITSIPNEIIHMMPVSNFFIDCLSEIKKGYTESMLILAQQKDVTTSTQTLTLFTALATNDRRLMEAMLNSFTEENRATGTDKLILLRGFTMNVTQNLEAILTVPLEPLTVIEKNALAFMEPFAIGIHRLNNTDL